MDKEMDIVEGNKIIAEFMGYTEINTHPEYDRWFTDKDLNGASPPKFN